MAMVKAVQDRCVGSNQGLALCLTLRLELGPMTVLIAPLRGAYAGSTPTRQCRIAFPHRTVLARRPSSGPWSTVGEELHQESYVVADVPGVDGFHEDNGVSGIYPGWRGSGRQPPLVRCASA